MAALAVLTAILCASPSGTAEAAGYYTVHVSSHQAAGEAASAAAEWAAKGFEAFHRAETVAGKGLWHRVCIGRTDSEREASRLAGKLRLAGAPYAEVLKVEQPGGEISPPPSVPLESSGTGSTYREKVYGQYVASFKYRRLAEDEAEVLNQYGWPATVVEADVLDAKWYRVYLLPPGEPAARAALSAGDTLKTPQAFEVLIDLTGPAEARNGGGPVCGEYGFHEAKLELVRKISAAVPSADYSAALRTVEAGPDSKASSRLVWGVSRFDLESFLRTAGLLQESPGLPSLAPALAASDAELAAMPGGKALIIISDFRYSAGSEEIPQRAADLKNRYGPDLCLYPVFIGADAEGMALARQTAEAGGCGSSYDGCLLLRSPEALASFVQRVFLGPELQFLPRRPAVAGDGADEDNDGVLDSNDECPGTPQGAPVDARGCWVAASSQYFDFNKAEVRPEYMEDLKKAAAIIANNPDINLLIAGHTDSKGSEAYNLELGRRRAEAVRRVLMSGGVEAGRLRVVSYGKNQPVADNTTDRGRALNRRVELHGLETGQPPVPAP